MAKLGTPGNAPLTGPVPLPLKQQCVDSSLHPFPFLHQPPTHLSPVTSLPPHPLQQFPVSLTDRVTSSRAAKTDTHSDSGARSYNNTKVKKGNKYSLTCSLTQFPACQPCYHFHCLPILTVSAHTPFYFPTVFCSVCLPLPSLSVSAFSCFTLTRLLLQLREQTVTKTLSEVTDEAPLLFVFFYLLPGRFVMEQLIKEHCSTAHLW